MKKSKERKQLMIKQTSQNGALNMECLFPRFKSDLGVSALH